MTRRTLPRSARIALVSVAAIVLLAGVATARAVKSGEARLAECDAALRRQDFAQATADARAAAAWYVPGAPHVDAAYARLLHVARTTEANGDKDAALFAWRAMRGAALESRHVAQPHERELAMANDAIARLSADGTRPMMTRDVTPEQAERHMRALLAREDAPRASWTLLLMASFALMLGGLLSVILRGLDVERGLDSAKLPLAVSLAGLVGYAIVVLR